MSRTMDNQNDKDNGSNHRTKKRKEQRKKQKEREAILQDGKKNTVQVQNNHQNSVNSISKSKEQPQKQSEKGAVLQNAVKKTAVKTVHDAQSASTKSNINKVKSTESNIGFQRRSRRRTKNVDKGSATKSNQEAKVEIVHAEMKLKLLSYYKLSTENNAKFENEVQQCKENLIKYTKEDKIPQENMYLLLLIFKKLTTSKDLLLFQMVAEYLRSLLNKKEFLHYLLIWSSKMDVSKCKLVADAYLTIIESCLHHKFLTAACLEGLQKFVDFLTDQSFNKRIKNLSQHFYNQYKEFQKNGETHLRFDANHTDLMSYDDFRRLPTFPTLEDFLITNKCVLRPIKEKGCYKNGEEYLDIQYRLIREDLLFTLKEGINELRQNITSKKVNLTVYQGIQVLYPMCTHRGITFKICFDPTSIRCFSWEQSRNLIFGSLLCFSNDSFQTMIFGTVADREPFELRRGFFDVCFQNNSEMYNYYRKNSHLQMVECPAYFEAYRHVLDCLKEINPYAMPMKKYLIENKTSGQLPVYLRVVPDAVYDMSSTLGEQQFKKVFISKTKLTSSINLNSSQLEALQHSLTNEFSVVQGPPGTGKTYCGLRIVDCLLSNQHVWNKNKDNPMLIVCFTNHALDQFLKGLIKFGHKNIIRIGGRACEELEPYLLKNYVSKFRSKVSKNDSYKCLQYRRKMSANSLKDFAQQLEPYLCSMKKSQEAVKKGKLVMFSEIKHCISKKHSNFFEEQDKHCHGLKISIFDIFLELCKIPLPILRNVSRLDKDYFNEMILHDTENEFLESQNKPTDLIEVIGEGNALTERWVVDEDQFKPLLFSHAYNFENENNFGDENSLFVDEEGFKLVTMSKTKKALKVRTKLEKCNAMSKEEVDAIENPWLIPIDNKWRLYKYWLELFMMDYDDKVAKQMQQYEESCRFAAQVREEEQEIVLRKADVIAMTTTCASRMRFVLQSIKPKIVVIEEAAEVLEAHIVASLLKETEHCILIGDHKQLRPNPNVHVLAEDYHLDLSLFERMVNNNMKCPSLNVQHRMRPAISSNLKYIYPNLIDHISVKSYPHVLGVEKNMYFINHSEPESFKKFGSKANLNEAKFMKSFCFYLLQQGYEPSQITILAGYSAQLLELQRCMPKLYFEGVKVTTIDNFQGEENDIILLSLVRSNERGSIGFLKIENRVCVALSRAKHGLYVIGNFSLLAEYSLLWRRIINDVINVGCFGDSLSLCCQNHPETKVEVSNESDFENVPEGGCRLMCGFVLPCGHVCDTFCHPYDKFHKDYDCREKCFKQMCEYKEHICLHQCHYGTKCNPCDNLVQKRFEFCGHISMVPCSISTSEAVCQEICDKIISCGHQCSNKCGEECSSMLSCKVIVSKVLKCGHMQKLFCNQSPDTAECNTKCEVELGCGHVCSGTCFQCFKGAYHMKCTMACNNFHICSHNCSVKCGQVCTPCEQPCPFRCLHKTCSNKCFETCEKCTQPCKNRCLHQKCTKLCYEECNIKPCNKRCSLLQNCQHQCYGLCGETCPTYCLLCTYKPNSIQSFPLIVLVDCGHVFPVSEIDVLFTKYCVSLVEYSKCPSCYEPILNTKRYRKQVNEIRNAFLKIQSYSLKKEASNAIAIMKDTYVACQTLSKFMLKTKLTSQEQQDYMFIINNKNLLDFQKNLDLRYLARSSTKSETLLIAERLIQSKNILTAQRLYNQIQILTFINYIRYSIAQQNSSIEVQNILNDFSDIIYNTIDNALTYHESEDLSKEAQRLQFQLQMVLCKQSIEQALSKAKSFSLAYLYTQLQQSILDFDLVHGDEFKKLRKKVFPMLNGKVSIPLTHIGKPTLLSCAKTDKIWSKCRVGHVFIVPNCDRMICPECGLSSFDPLNDISPISLSDEEFFPDNKASSNPLDTLDIDEFYSSLLPKYKFKYVSLPNDQNIRNKTSSVNIFLKNRSSVEYSPFKLMNFKTSMLIDIRNRAPSTEKETPTNISKYRFEQQSDVVSNTGSLKDKNKYLSSEFVSDESKTLSKDSLYCRHTSLNTQNRQFDNIPLDSCLNDESKLKDTSDINCNSIHHPQHPSYLGDLVTKMRNFFT